MAAILPALISAGISSGLVPRLIETGAGLVKQLLGSTPIGGLAGPIIDTGAKLLGNLTGAIGGERSSPPPVTPMGARMDVPTDVGFASSTPAGRGMLMPENLKDVANVRPFVLPLRGSVTESRHIPVVRSRRRQRRARRKRQIKRYF